MAESGVVDRHPYTHGHFLVYTQNESKQDLESVSDVEPYMPSENEIIHNKPTNYVTKTLFVVLIGTGVVLIGTGVGLLITCRHDIGEITCDLYMDRQPCSPLATSTYLGCAVILATVFGFGCVGRKAMACLLLCILLTEVTFGIYLIVKKKSTLTVQLETGLEMARETCPVTTGSRAGHIACWNRLSSVRLPCLATATNVIRRCNESSARNVTAATVPAATSTLTSLRDARDEMCAAALNEEIIAHVWAQLFIEGPVLIVLAPLHLIIAAWLWLMRFTQSSLKYELRLKSAISSCLLRKMSETPAPTNAAQQFESLIGDRPPPVLMHRYARIASQKYVVKKLNKQKNAYATV